MECVKKSHERCKVNSMDPSIKYSHKIIKGIELQNILNRKSTMMRLESYQIL